MAKTKAQAIAEARARAEARAMLTRPSNRGIAKRQIIVESESESESENERETKPEVSDVKRKNIGPPENCSEEKPHQFEMNPNVSSGNKLRWKFKNVNKLTNDGLTSDKFTFQNTDWKIKIHTFTEKNLKYLSIILIYVSENGIAKNWICETTSVFKLLNQKWNGKDTVGGKDNTHHFAGMLSRCHSKFISWSKLENDGYLKYDTIIVEVDMSFKYYDFSKNIPTLTDITLDIGDTKFYVNKGVLSLHSIYFFNLFVNENNQENNIKIDDVDATIFLYLIASFCPQFRATSKLYKYEELIELAEKYGVSTLHEICENSLVSSTELPVIDKLKRAEQHNYYKLMKSCVESLKTAQQVRVLQRSIEFNNFKESTKTALFNRVLELI